MTFLAFSISSLGIFPFVDGFSQKGNLGQKWKFSRILEAVQKPFRDFFENSRGSTKKLGLLRENEIGLEGRFET
jgi:hypothetical protein